MSTELECPAVRFQRLGDRLWISHFRCRWQNGLLLALFLIFWTVGIVFLVDRAVSDPRVLNLLLLVPLVASWFAIFWAAITLFAQHDEFTLDSHGATLVRRVMLPITTQRVPLDEILGFDSSLAQRGWCPEVGSSAWGIGMRTLSMPGSVTAHAQFAFGLSDQDREWLKQQLNDHLSGLQKHLLFISADAWRRNVRDRTGSPHQRVEAMAATGDALRPLSDFRWLRDDALGSISFRLPGRLNVNAVLLMLFLASFCNGIVWTIIVALFTQDVQKPVGADWWIMIFFCFPFGLMGVLLVAGLFLELLAPLRSTIWRIAGDSIEHRIAWIGIGRTRRYSVGRLGRLNLRPPQVYNPRNPKHVVRSIMCPRGSDFNTSGLSIIDSGNTEICTIHGLTEAEAQWIANIVLRECRHCDNRDPSIAVMR